MSFMVEGMEFRYPNATQATLTIPKLVIQPKRTTAILGHSGSGKSTLLAALSLLQTSAGLSGTIRYHARETHWDYSAIDDRIRRDLRLKHFGLVLQKPFLLAHLTCLENIALPMLLAGHTRTDALQRARELLKLAGLDHLADRLARKTSGGERQRVSVLRAISNDPDVIFADEPVSNLDDNNAEVVLDLLRRWQCGLLRMADNRHGRRTLIIVTHDLRYAWRYAQQFVILERGAIKAPGIVKRRVLKKPAELYRLTEGIFSE